MGKVIKYKCDICGCPIQEQRRKITSPQISDGKRIDILSTHPSIIRLIIQQIDVDREYPERETKMDICNSCYEALEKVFNGRR